MVTDKVIRETGLIDTVIAGVEDGGLEVAGVFDDVPQDSSTDVVDRCAEEAKAAGADSFLAVGGGSVMDTAKIADAMFTHGGTAAESEGFFLMPRADDGMGAPLPMAPLACIPTTCGTGLGGVDGGGRQGPRAQGQARDRRLPAVPAPRDPRPRVHEDAAAEHRGRHRDGRDDTRDRGLRLTGLEPATRTAARSSRCG